MYRPIVIAGSRSQFGDWCRAHRTNPSAAIFVQTPAELRTALIANVDVWLWGDYARNPAFAEYLTWRQKRAA